ncbi:MAG: hypothetical protein EOM26_00350 [Alphaproteobacteria bacterium]|nr:hypothetical protein [Alphaproteobacteria bacterium]
MHFPRTKWRKIGLVVKPQENLWWMRSHAMLPTPEHIRDSVYRIYFASRNDKNQSHIGFAVIDIREPERVLEFSDQPVLAPGRLGTFDDNGVLPSCVIGNGEETLLYTIGFKPGGTTRMDLFGGLAVSYDGISFSRWSEAPIIERCRVNPFINTAPWVLREASGYRMYYVAGVEWVHVDLPRYNIQTAISSDGKNWERSGMVAIDFAEHENALARPYVVSEDGIYRMWFSSKGDFYLPRYAESEDGLNWTRYDEAVGLAPSAGGPDEEMVCYPVVLKHLGQHVMFYNGNGYGKNGICVAVEE